MYIFSSTFTFIHFLSLLFSSFPSSCFTLSFSFMFKIPAFESLDWSLKTHLPSPGWQDDTLLAIKPNIYQWMQHYNYGETFILQALSKSIDRNLLLEMKPRTSIIKSMENHLQKWIKFLLMENRRVCFVSLLNFSTFDAFLLSSCKDTTSHHDCFVYQLSPASVSFSVFFLDKRNRF